MEIEDRNSVNLNDSSFLDQLDDTNYEYPKSRETNHGSYHSSEEEEGEDEDFAGLYYK
jgi:hypothetical protein